MYHFCPSVQKASSSCAWSVPWSKLTRLCTISWFSLVKPPPYPSVSIGGLNTSDCLQKNSRSLVRSILYFNWNYAARSKSSALALAIPILKKSLTISFLKSCGVLLLWTAWTSTWRSFICYRSALNPSASVLKSLAGPMDSEVASIYSTVDLSTVASLRISSSTLSGVQSKLEFAALSKWNACDYLSMYLRAKVKKSSTASEPP